MSNSIDVFLNPSQETLQHLDQSLAQLRSLGSAQDQKQVPDHVFQVATVLLSHNRPEYIAEGVAIMERIAFASWQDFQRLENTLDNKKLSGAAGVGSGIDETDTNPTLSNRSVVQLETERKKARETLIYSYFLLGVGQFKLGDLSAARGAVEKMLNLEPHHHQGVALRDRIDEIVMRNAAIGVAAAAAAAIGIGALLKKIFH